MGFEGSESCVTAEGKTCKTSGVRGGSSVHRCLFAHSETKDPRFPLARYRTAYFCMSMSRVQSWIIRRTLKSRERD